MLNIKCKINWENDELYCHECKEKIHRDEKYAILLDEVYGEPLERPLHLDCLPDEEEDD
jgi:hypothetical protein